MKKILSIALVALLAVSSVFAADFSGSASVGLGYNFGDKTYGFSNSNEASIDIEAEYTSAAVDQVADGDIYAGIKASFLINFVADSEEAGYDVDTCEIEEAYITNGEWKLSVLGAGKGVDYAKSAVDTYFDWTAFSYLPVTYKAPFNAASGVELSYNGWRVGVGLDGNMAADVLNYSAVIEAPEFVVEGFKVQAAALISQNKEAEMSEYEGGYMLDQETGEIVPVVEDWEAIVLGYEETIAAGVSAKASYATDAVSASVAADLGFEDIKSDVVVIDFDAAANVTVAPVAVDAYYNHLSKLVSAKTSIDLAAYELPVKLTVSAKDILDAKNLGVKAEISASEALALTAEGSYSLKTNAWSVSGSAKYKAETFTAKAGATFNYNNANAMQLYANASIESDSVLPGTTLKLAFSPNSAGRYPNNKVVSNFLDSTTKDYGRIEASCTIEF